MSHSSRLEVLEIKRDQLKAGLAEIGDMRPGSLVGPFRKCGNPACHCMEKDAPGHGPCCSLTHASKADGDPHMPGGTGCRAAAASRSLGTIAFAIWFGSSARTNAFSSSFPGMNTRSNRAKRRSNSQGCSASRLTLAATVRRAKGHASMRSAARKHCPRDWIQR